MHELVGLTPVRRGETTWTVSLFSPHWVDVRARRTQTFDTPSVLSMEMEVLAGLEPDIGCECRRMRSRAGQRVPISLQMLVVAVCATTTVVAAHAEDYCGETTAKCIVAIGKS